MSQPDTEQTEDDAPADDIPIDDMGVADVTDVDGIVFDSAEEATEPGRNVDHITATLEQAHHGDHVKLVFGTASVKTSITGEVVGIKGQNSNRPPDAGWEKAIEVRGPEGNEEKGRLYRMGIGGGQSDPWLIYSYQYYPQLDMLEMEDAAWHGWIIDAQQIPEGWE